MKRLIVRQHQIDKHPHLLEALGVFTVPPPELYVISEDHPNITAILLMLEEPEMWTDEELKAEYFRIQQQQSLALQQQAMSGQYGQAQLANSAYNPAYNQMNPNILGNALSGFF